MVNNGTAGAAGAAGAAALAGAALAGAGAVLLVAILFNLCVSGRHHCLPIHKPYTQKANRANKK
jgi:hypothetical protein